MEIAQIWDEFEWAIRSGVTFYSYHFFLKMKCSSMVEQSTHNGRRIYLSRMYLIQM